MVWLRTTLPCLGHVDIQQCVYTFQSYCRQPYLFTHFLPYLRQFPLSRFLVVSHTAWLVQHQRCWEPVQSDRGRACWRGWGSRRRKRRSKYASVRFIRKSITFGLHHLYRSGTNRRHLLFFLLLPIFRKINVVWCKVRISRKRLSFRCTSLVQGQSVLCSAGTSTYEIGVLLLNGRKH